MKYDIFCKAIKAIDENNAKHKIQQKTINNFVEQVMRFVYLGRHITYRKRSNKHKKLTVYMSVYEFHNNFYDKDTMFSPYGNLHKEFLSDKCVQSLLDVIRTEYNEQYRKKTTMAKGLSSKEHGRELIYRYIMHLLLKAPEKSSDTHTSYEKRVTRWKYDTADIKYPRGCNNVSAQSALEFLFSKKRDVPDHRTIGPRKTNNYD